MPDPIPPFLLSVVGVPAADGSAFQAHPLVRIRHETSYVLFGLHPITVPLDAMGNVDLGGALSETEEADFAKAIEDGVSHAMLVSLRADLCRKQARERVLLWLRTAEMPVMLGILTNRDATSTQIVRIAAAVLWGPLALRDDMIRPEHLPVWTSLIIRRRGDGAQDAVSTDATPEVIAFGERAVQQVLLATRKALAAEKVALNAAAAAARGEP